MKTKYGFAVSVLVLCSAPMAFGLPTPQTMSLSDITRAAENANHVLKAAKSEETVAEKQISIAEGDYLPHLEADAIETGGFPGSSKTLGIGGLVGSPYRSGMGAGLLASATIWDFGRTLNSVRSAEHLSRAQKAQTELTRQDVDTQAAELYYECVQFKSQLNAWSFVYSQAELVSKEVEHFVRTGQRSIVERYLSKAQLEEALTHQKDYEERLLRSIDQLQILTRLPLQNVSCPSLSQLGTTPPVSPPSSRHDKQNALLVRATENALASQAQADYAKDDFLPKLKAFAGVGALEKSRVVDKQDYAFGFGIEIPLFDGFKTINQVQSAQAKQEAQQQLVGAARDQIDLVNAHFDQLIESAKVRIAHLDDELTLANEGFTVAKNRYLSLQGTLVDLREALRNLMRTRSDAIDAQTALLLTETEKTIFNEEVNNP